MSGELGRLEIISKEVRETVASRKPDFKNSTQAKYMESLALGLSMGQMHGSKEVIVFLGHLPIGNKTVNNLLQELNEII